MNVVKKLMAVLKIVQTLMVHTLAAAILVIALAMMDIPAMVVLIHSHGIVSYWYKFRILQILMSVKKVPICAIKRAPTQMAPTLVSVGRVLD